MDLAQLQRKLIAAARLHAPSWEVPPAFEKRVLANLTARAVLDRWSMWSRALWRATAPCIGIMLLLGALSWLAPPAPPPPADFSQDFENTVLAAAESEPPAELLW